MKNNFDNCIQEILNQEGGYSNHPADEGGPTNMGITLVTLSNYLGHIASIAEVQALSKETAKEIYRVNYWNKIKGDDLPAGIDLLVFDFAVNSGVSRAVKYLQKIIGCKMDGICGKITLAALNAFLQDKGSYHFAITYQNMREQYLKGLSNYNVFGKGWMRRIKHIMNVALTYIINENSVNPNL